jgi:hypothetical protein
MIAVFQPSSFCDCVSNHIYFKVIAVFVMSLLITFVDDIDIFYEKGMLILFILIFVLSMSIHTDDVGTLILLTVIIILIYNNIITK